MSVNRSFVRLCAATALALSTAVSAIAEVRVIDGDTFESDTERVRLFGIDAPESDQPGGAQAAEALRRLIGKADPNCTEVDRDRYGRMVALCSISGGDLSLAMLRAGHAVVWCHYVRKLRPNLLGSFQRMELEARRAKIGIWARKFEPWRDWEC